MGRPEAGHGIRWRLWLNVAIISVALVAVIFAGRRVWRFVATDGRFTLAGPDARDAGLSVDGLVYTPRSRVLATLSPDFGRSVFQAPIAERRRRLLAIGWVQDASIARIWPNRLAVRIKERTPVAFVNLSTSGGRGSRVMLIDGEGVLLEPPPQSHFTFPVLSGVYEEQTEPERRLRVQAMQRLIANLGPLAQDISEVNAEAPENLVVVTQLEGCAIELVLGNQNFPTSMRNFLDHYPEIKRHAGNVRVFDLRLDDRITAGARP